MKRAVSVSIGSSTRDKRVEIELLGQKVRLERIGTDGDMEKAAELYRQLDGQVDAFGVGGADLGLYIDGIYFPLHSVKPMIRYVEKTPVVDGSGLKHTLEARLAPFLEEKLGDQIQPKRVLLTSALDRWGMARSFIDAGYEFVIGDLMFGLGVPIAMRSVPFTKLLARILLPIVGRMPFEWIYPTGETQEKRTPKWEKYYRWATVIAGDAHYIKRFMPDRLEGKIIVTNTTTEADRELFQRAGVAYLVTSTPVLEGRSFGTNMMEAALVAVAGKGRALTHPEIEALIDQLGFEPQIQKLN